MKVLYLVFRALLGGHVLSAKTIAIEMKKHGIVPIFAGAKGALVEDIESHMPFETVNIPIYHGSKQTYFTWRSFPAIKKLRSIINKHQIDLIHAFDARSYLHAYLAGLMEDIPVICTLCGGTDPYYNIPQAPSIIVFSEEQKRKMTRAYRWHDKQVDVIRTRLDLKPLYSDQNKLSDTEAADFGIIPTSPKIMMISSFDGTKSRSIHMVIDAIEILFNQGVNCQLVFIGGKGSFYEQARKRGEQLCRQYGKGRVSFTGPVVGAFRLLQHATIVLGVGRSAFEGMAYGKPTLIVGENGFAGEVAPNTVKNIAWYNFSGRNQKKFVSARCLADTIGYLLDNPVRCKDLGDFGKNYIFKEIDVALGAARIAKLYNRVSSRNGSISVLSKWYSFVTCLFPIVTDNMIHSIRKSCRKSETSRTKLMS